MAPKCDVRLKRNQIDLEIDHNTAAMAVGLIDLTTF
jgi:hypothetical protein